MLALFIDRLGSTMAYPFFSLYITEKFNVGMAEAGLMLGLFSISGFIGRMVGGALTDRFGRRSIVVFGMVASALSSIAFGVVNEYAVFFVLAVVVGLPSNVAGPAYNAMIADILPEEQRTEGYGILRVVRNLAWVIGPSVGGLLIARSYLLIFVADAVASLIVAAIFFKVMPETMPEKKEGEVPEKLSESFLGYARVAKDQVFLLFTLAVIFSGLAYHQIYNTLPVFLRDVHEIPESGYGYLMTANSILVVLSQFWLTSKISRWKPLNTLSVGAFLYMIGLVMYGVFSAYGWFMAAMLIITVGEMMVLPTSQAMAAKFAPENMRGRYMAFYGLTMMLPAAIGPGTAGLIMDKNPSLLWFLCGLSCLVAIGMFLMLNRRIEKRAMDPVPEAG